MADTKFFFILLTVLAFVSIPTALIVMDYNNWNENKTSDYSSCPAGAYCPAKSNVGFVTSLTGNISLADTDYTNTTAIFEDYSWRYNKGVGTLSQFSGIPFYDYYLLIPGINPDINGYYTVTYLINNSVKERFLLVLHGKRTATGLVLECTNDGFKIPGLIPYMYDYTYNIPNMFTTRDHLIQTKYNPSTNNLIVFYQGIELFGITAPAPVFLTAFDSSNYYGGIGTKANGITLISYTATSGQTISGNAEELTILDKVWEVVPYHDQIETFTGVIFDLVNPFDSYGNDMTGTPIIPWWISVFFIIITIGIVAYGIQILRGN